MNYFCLFLISGRTRNQLSAASHIKISKCHRSWSESAPFTNPLHPPSMRKEPAASINRDKSHTLYNDSILRTTSYPPQPPTLLKVKTDINSTTLQHKETPSQARNQLWAPFQARHFEGYNYPKKVRSQGKIRQHTCVYFTENGASPV